LHITDDSSKPIRETAPFYRLQVYFCLQEEIFPVKFPQETYCFTLNPGTYDIKVTTCPDTEQHSKISMRIFSKRMYEVERNIQG
jgi:hypothetical protein